MKKKVVKHLKGDIEGFKKEITEDKKLLKAFKDKEYGKECACGKKYKRVAKKGSKGKK